LKYTTARQQNWTWLSLSAAWAAGAISAWLASVFSTTDSAGTGELFGLALIIAAIGLALRLPIITNAPHADQWSDHVVLLLGYAATVNWLGFLLFRASGMFVSIPAVTVLVLAEVWIHCRFYYSDCLAWLRSAPVAEDRPAVHRQSEDSPLQAAGPIQRTCVDGVDEQGRRYLSGEIQVTLSAGQTSQELVVGFCPAFAGDPEVDFEVADEHVAARLVQCSPAGMRLAIRRSGAKQSGQSPTTFQLQWYALQSEPGAEHAHPPGERLLP
jgi:hypothetical protein